MLKNCFFGSKDSSPSPKNNRSRPTQNKAQPPIYSARSGVMAWNTNRRPGLRITRTEAYRQHRATNPQRSKQLLPQHQQQTPPQE